MAAKPLVEQLVDRLSQLTQIVMDQQALLFALVDYQREQPSHDASRFGTIYREQRERLNVPKTEAQQHDAALQALLRDFEGPIQ